MDELISSFCCLGIVRRMFKSTCVTYFKMSEKDVDTVMDLLEVILYLTRFLRHF